MHHEDTAIFDEERDMRATKLGITDGKFLGQFNHADGKVVICPLYGARGITVDLDDLEKLELFVYNLQKRRDKMRELEEDDD